MLKFRVRFGSILHLFIVVNSIMAMVLVSTIPIGKSAYSGAVKPMEFYLHYSDAPVSVAGLQTKYIVKQHGSSDF